MFNAPHVAATHGSYEQGEYCSSGFTALFCLNRDINYLLYFYFTLLTKAYTDIISVRPGLQTSPKPYLCDV